MKVHKGNKKQSVPLRTSYEPADFQSLSNGPNIRGRRHLGYIGMIPPNRKSDFKNQLCAGQCGLVIEC